MSNITVKQAVDTIREALKEDRERAGSYYMSWQSNIAMAFYDEWQRQVNDSGLPCTPEHIHEIANKSACNFLDQLIS